jgi:transcriptional regulator with XRE-family HTH domain
MGGCCNLTIHHTTFRVMASKHINFELNALVGAKLQRVRLRAQEKQSNIAEAMNVSNTTYSKHEHGKIDFTVTKLNQISDYFKVKMSDFLDERFDIPRLLKDCPEENDYKILEAKYNLLKELYQSENQSKR